MSFVASRDLRNHTSDILGRAAGGEVITITVNGSAVAELSAARSPKPAFFGRLELARLLSRHRADAGLRADLSALAGDTTDDLGSP